jgi:class 3 adenylate cyclase
MSGDPEQEYFADGMAMGDGLLVEFSSVVDAVCRAVRVQREMALRNADLTVDRRIEFRIGINLGDIIKDGREIYGDGGVNVAARLEALATPGGICVSRVVRDQVRDKLGFAFDGRGDHHRAQPHPLAVRHRPQFELHLQEDDRSIPNSLFTPRITQRGRDRPAPCLQEW